MKFISFIALFLISFLNFTFPQGEAAVPFLQLNPSPQLIGLGLTGVSYPNDDAMGYYYNPANLGYMSQTNNISFQTLPETDWLNFGFVKINSLSFNIGYNFQKVFGDINISAGFGYIRNKIHFGTFYLTSEDSPDLLGTFESYDLYNAYSLGVSLDYYINFSFGMSIKDVHSKMSDYFSGNNIKSASADVTAADYGFLFVLPVVKLIDNDYSYDLTNSKLKPSFDYSFGFSRLNIGNEISYIDTVQADPLPLTARLGHTINLGLDLESEAFSIKLLSYSLILEAEDILIDRTTEKFKYQGILGDINFGKHLIDLRSDEKVVVHKGHAINLMETVTLLYGSYSGRGFNRNVNSEGFLISTRGLFKIINSNADTNFLKFLTNHFEIKYISVSTFNKESIETDISGISVSFINYSFL